jgi:hypothetical protein
MKKVIAVVSVLLALLWGSAVIFIDSIYDRFSLNSGRLVSAYDAASLERVEAQPATGCTGGGPKSEKEIEMAAQGEAYSIKPVEQPQEVHEDVRYKSAGIDPTSIGLPASQESEGEKYKKGLKGLLSMVPRTGNNTFTLASRGGGSLGYEGRAPLLRITNEDESYVGDRVELSDEDRDFVERVVMGEAGGEDYVGKALVAQAIRDAMVTDGLTAREVWANFKYTPRIGREPNDDVKKAVSYIFNGGYVVKHRVLYFYAPALVSSPWHETQEFVIEHGGHRFFDRRD